MIHEQRRFTVMAAIRDEYSAAEKAFPTWWQDMVYAASTAMEESGEAVQAVNDYCLHNKGSLEKIRTEAVQSATMWIRFLVETEALWPKSATQSPAAPA